MTESFSTRLNNAMALRELKQIDFVRAAEKFNIKLGKSHMSQYVSGKTVPRADIAHFLAAYLHVNEDWLMGADVPMEEHAANLPEPSDEPLQHDDATTEQSTEGKRPCAPLPNPTSLTMFSMMFVDRSPTKPHAWRPPEPIS